MTGRPARVVALTALGLAASWGFAVGQGGGWAATPDGPSVGDTIWLAREVAVPAGWRVRAAKLDGTSEVQPLGEAMVLSSPAGWLIRYPVVAWTPGAHTLSLPPIWRLGPDGRADSTAGGTASFRVTSVIPDTVRQPTPRGLLAPLHTDRRDPFPPVLALAVAAGLLAVCVAWRRRPSRGAPSPPHAPVEREVPDARWLAAGEPKAVAARAVAQLRRAVAGAVPEAHPALSTSECLAVVARVRPQAPLRELRDLLEQLDRVVFASAHGTDVAALSTMARRLARELAP